MEENFICVFRQRHMKNEQKETKKMKGKSRWWNKIKDVKPGEGNSQYNDRKYCLIRLKNCGDRKVFYIVNE